MRASLANTLPRFVLLYAAMYAAFGVASPFLPAFVSERGIPPEQLGLVLAAGTAIRLVSAPLAARVGDLIRGLRIVLIVCVTLASAVTLGYLAAHGLWTFLVVSLLQAAALAPMTVLSDALALGSAAPRWPPFSCPSSFTIACARPRARRWRACCYSSESRCSATSFWWPRSSSAATPCTMHSR
jgi:MFS family permease